jgi:hypothetical protein
MVGIFSGREKLGDLEPIRRKNKRNMLGCGEFFKMEQNNMGLGWTVSQTWKRSCHCLRSLRAGRRGDGFWLGLGFELSTDVLRAGRPGPAEIDAGYVLFAVGGKGSGNTEGRFRTVRGAGRRADATNMDFGKLGFSRVARIYFNGAFLVEISRMRK